MEFKISHMKLILLPLFFLTGCVHYYPAQVSSASMGGKYERPIQVVTGKSQADYILGFGPFGNDSLQAALEDAIQKNIGHTLINTFVDRKIICFPACGIPLYARVETSITGTMVALMDDTGKPLPLSQYEPLGEVFTENTSFRVEQTYHNDLSDQDFVDIATKKIKIGSNVRVTTKGALKHNRESFIGEYLGFINNAVGVKVGSRKKWIYYKIVDNIEILE
jgi:hypothetical protein